MEGGWSGHNSVFSYAILFVSKYPHGGLFPAIVLIVSFIACVLRVEA